jgi:hypothetical protein
MMMSMLTKACGEDALKLFLELMQQAAAIGGEIRFRHYSSRPIADDQMARYGIYDALMSAVLHSAEMLIKEAPARMRSILSLLEGYSSKIFARLVLHLLATDPAAASDLADAYLINPELVEASWCRHEYAELALAWFPSLTAEKRATVLHVVDSIPNKHRAAWKLRFEEWKKEPPTRDDERKFEAGTFRDVVWMWRDVLPPERQESLKKIVSELWRSAHADWTLVAAGRDSSYLGGFFGAANLGICPLPEIVEPEGGAAASDRDRACARVAYGRAQRSGKICGGCG